MGGERRAVGSPYPGGVTPPQEPAPWLDALAGSHDRLSELVQGLDGAGLRRPSYCEGWSIAQVLSHLGSGAQIFHAALDSVVDGASPLSREAMRAIWDRWNAMEPEEQSEGFLATDGQLVEALENLGDRMDALEFTLFGAFHVDAAGFLALRLGEHALHAWDVAVALDPPATLDADAAALLVDQLPETVGRLDTPHETLALERPFTVRVHTADPLRSFDLTIDDPVRLEPVGDGARQDGSGSVSSSDPAEGRVRAELHLPAEALVRLVYGRLDPAHRPELSSEESETVETLRQVFRGL